MLGFLGRLKRIIIEGYRYTKYSCFPAGHYYSPIVNLDEKDIEKTILSESFLKDIRLNEKEQLDNFSSFSTIFKEIPEWDHNQNLRYNFNNKWYPSTDGVFLYAMLRSYQPKQIIEVGSGYSSALMLDTNDLFFNSSVNFTFIEPNPERLESLLKKEDYKNTVIVKENVQNVDVESFKKLQANDFLFIDSSHIAKTGSDVNYLFFKVFPALNSGVIIHLHDIFYPFEYPKDWVLGGRNWNEIYLLRAFLQNNSDYDIVLFTDFLQTKYPSLIDQTACFDKQKNGSSFYFIKK